MPFDPTSYAAPVQPKVDPDAEVLLRAAEIIEERGWCRLMVRGPNGERCLAGAVLDAAVELDHFDRIEGCVERLGLLAPADMCTWNNAWGRTAAEVIARLRETARG